MSKRMRQHVATINPNLIKSRDLVHLQEITHPSGAGFHKGKRDIQARDNKRNKQKGWDSDSSPYHICVVAY
jgi:hypothetical protein